MSIGIFKDIQLNKQLFDSAFVQQKSQTKVGDFNRIWTLDFLFAKHACMVGIFNGKLPSWLV